MGSYLPVMNQSMNEMKYEMNHILNCSPFHSLILNFISFDIIQLLAKRRK